MSQVFRSRPSPRQRGVIKECALEAEPLDGLRRSLADRDVLSLFHPAVAEWFRASFDRPTPPQVHGWPAIARGASALILAPTGSGKTLAAFLWCINRLMFEPAPPPPARCRVLYISPLKALAVDIERNLRAPRAGIASRAAAREDAHHIPAIAIRTGDTPAVERARFLREPADILITTPESLYLLLTSNARAALRSIDTVIIDEIHALVPTKRGAHLALSLERLEDLVRLKPDATPSPAASGSRPHGPSGIQRIGLSATQRPLDEVARFLGGLRHTRRSRAKGRPTDARATLHDEFSAPRLRSGQAGRPLNAECRPVTIVDAISRGARQLLVYIPEDEPARSAVARALAARLALLARPEDGRGGLLVSEITGTPAGEHPFATYLVEAGFTPSAMGFQMRRRTS